MPEIDTVNSAFHAALDERPDALFLDFSGKALSYAGFDERVRRLARGLRDLGIGKGDRVATVLDNGPQAVVAWFAVNRLGAIWVPLNTSYVGEFLRHQIADCGAKVVIAQSEYIPRFDALAGGLPALETLLHHGPEVESAAAVPWRLADLTEYIGDADPLPAVDVANADLAGLFYTAGTTGPSKGCMISHTYMNHIGRVVNLAAERTSDEPAWTPMPLFHTGALSMVAGTLQLRSSLGIAPRFSVREFWPEIERSGARVVMLMATMMPLLAKAPDTPESLRCKGQIRAALGLPFPPALQQVWRDRFGVEVPGFNTFGQTEAAMVTVVPGGRGAKPGCSGLRHEWVDVRVFDEDDRECPPNVIGEIVVRPLQPHVMFEGYWNRPEATLAQLKNLWFHSGDLGYFDEDGFLFFADRKKDYLRRGGENISSFEMESTYLQHEAIIEVAVHAVLSELAEDDVKVTAVLRPGAQLTAIDLFAWSLERVPRFALPRYIEFRSELPKNPVGRVLKYQLREEGCTPGTWDRHTCPVHAAR